MAQGAIRAFLAIEISEKLKQEASSFVDAIRDHYPSFRFIPSQNWHLTLHFLGHVELKKIEMLQERLSGQALMHVKPFTISLSGLGTFPVGQKPRILWIGIDGDHTGLLTLKQGLDQVLQKLHLEIENRPYHPHITIARSKGEAPHPKVNFEPQFKGQSAEEIRHITLFKSILSAQGAEHISLGKFSFGDLQ